MKNHRRSEVERAMIRMDDWCREHSFSISAFLSILTVIGVLAWFYQQ
jgi:hypothetical protein